MTRKWYATLRHPKMYPHTKFGIPTSKNIGDMDRTRKRDGRTDGRTDGLTDGLTDRRTVRLLYASQSSFGGIKMYIWRCCFFLKPQVVSSMQALSSGLSYRNNVQSISPVLFEVGSVDTPCGRRVLHTVLASL